MDVITLLVSTGAATIIVALITAVFNRKKLSADATQIITQAAAGTVQTIMADNAQLREKIAGLESNIAKITVAVAASERRERAHAVIEERYRWHLDRWHRYCSRISDELRAMGGKIEDPPPMWPDLVLPVDDEDDSILP